MEWNCKFEYQNWYAERVDEIVEVYTCVVEAAKIDKPATVIQAFIGTHWAGKGHKDVEALSFSCWLMKHFPRGIQNVFPGLRVLHVHNCGFTSIARSDFDGLQSLEALYIWNNQLKSLPSNLFVGMSKLKIINFNSNQIESMSSDILKPVMNNDLLWVDFESNGNLNAFFGQGASGSVASIEKLMKIIDANCTKPTNYESLAPDQQEELITNLKEYFTDGLSDLWKSKKFADFTIKDPEINEMSIMDLDEAVVEAFLRFFYYGDVADDVNFIQLLKLSVKLDVVVLTTQLEMILSGLEDSNAFEIFRLGHTYGNEEFKKQAFEWIRGMFPDIDNLMNKPDELKQLIEAQQLLNSIKDKIKKL